MGLPLLNLGSLSDFQSASDSFSQVLVPCHECCYTIRIFSCST